MTSHSLSEVRVGEVDETDVASISQGYALLQQALGVGLVEDPEAFRRTVSRDTDRQVIPGIICARAGGAVVGIVVGAYLKRLKVGFVAYSAVAAPYRRLGMYTAMRNGLIALFNREAAVAGSQQVRAVVSEQEEGSPLFRRYLEEWGAFVAPCAYEQPSVQGLTARPLKLVLQPLGGTAPTGSDEVLEIVREVYHRIYRIDGVDEDESFRRVAASMARAATRRAG